VRNIEVTFTSSA